jgi:hypothetical protein
MRALFLSGFFVLSLSACQSDAAKAPSDASVSSSAPQAETKPDAAPSADAPLTVSGTPVGLGEVIDLRSSLPKGAQPLADLDPKKADRVSIRPKDRANGLAFDILSWSTSMPKKGSADGDRLVAGYAVDVTSNPNNVKLSVKRKDEDPKGLALLFNAEWKTAAGSPTGWTLAGKVIGAIFVADD